MIAGALSRVRRAIGWIADYAVVLAVFVHGAVLLIVDRIRRIGRRP